MNTLTVGARTLELDKDGYLVDLNEWSADVANALAAAEALELTPGALGNPRAAAPVLSRVPAVPRHTPADQVHRLEAGRGQGNSLHLNKLFNGTPAKLAAKLAGLPRPTNCL
nr:TusE/DsrC/DsvC family sulfur relay protein [Pseudomonas veronii]